MFNLMHKDGMNKSFISIFALCVAAISVTVSGITKSVTSSPFKYRLAPTNSGFESLLSNSISHHAFISVIYTLQIRLIQ